MRFPVKEKFILDNDFINNYSAIRPNWGFNGLGEFVFMRTYSRLIDGKNETWVDAIRRVVEGIYTIQKQHIKDHKLRWNEAKAQKSAKEMFDRIFNFKMLPSGRAFWAMGTPIVMERGLTESLYNCSYLSSKKISENPGLMFANLMDFLMLGVGVGFDVQGAGKITVVEQGEKEKYIIEDSREGWVESTHKLINSFFGEQAYEFDYSLIRKAGEPIKTFGGVSAGAEPLIKLHNSIIDTLTKNIGLPITATTITDIANMIGVAVVSGNVRRCLPKGTLVHTGNGLKNIENVTKNDYVYTANGLKKVKNNFQQGIQKVISIKTQVGSIECTPNHRLAVLKTPYEYEWKEASNVSEKDYLVFVRNVMEGKKTSLPEFKYEKPFNSTTCKDISVPELDEEISWFFGNFHGDGYVYPNFEHNGFNGYVSIATSPEYPNITEMVRNVLMKFGVNPRNVGPTLKDRSIKVSVQSKQLAWYLSQFKESNKNISVPEFIKNGTPEIRGAYLAGLFDADGSSKSRPINAVTSVYLDFVKEIQALYASLGIPTRIKETKRIEHNWKTIYSVNIVGERTVFDFEKYVAVYSLKYKNNRKTQRSGNDFTFSKEFLSSSNLKSSRNLTFEKFNQEFDPTNLMPVKVYGINDFENLVETFDIEVEDDHEFIINQGLLVHNSAEIALGNPTDEFLDLKNYNKNPERMMWGWASNNSIYAELGMDYSDIAERIAINGEPGLFWKENAQKYGRMRADEANWADKEVEGLNP